ncbi:MAG: hypothetical protein IT391_18565 [Nitrospira sp.]|nr:hypothetical protein [Nitrospira sp.]
MMMRAQPFLWMILCFYAAIVTPAMAEDMGFEERIRKLEQKLRDIEQERPQPHGATSPAAESAESSPTSGGTALPEIGRDLRRPKQAPLSFSTGGSGTMIYAKPFVSAPKAFVGGYFDLQYRNHRKDVIDNGAGSPGSNPGIGSTNSSFDQQRFVPFIYADITEHVKFASELEIEHGIREGTETEVSLEFAHVDYLFSEPVNLRAGIILLPVGKFNLLHDSPLNDLTDRPLVNQYIIPTTLSEAGAGFYGTFYPGRQAKMDYEFYVTQGPNGYQPDGTARIGEASGLKNSRQRKSLTDDGFDNNRGKAVVGRVAYSPVLGVEIAGSGYHGTYDPESKRSLSIVVLDWTLQRGPFELIGEAAWAYMKNNSRNLDGTPAIDPDTGRLRPQRMNGYYIQGNYHFMPEVLRRWLPQRFSEGSTMTAVVRWDKINTNRDAAGGFGDLEQLSLGLNFRPIEDTVFKVSYQFGTRAFNPNTNQRIHDNALVLSAATYF